MRSRVALAPAAFVGKMCSALQRMLDSQASDGGFAAGFMPSLEVLLGPGSFAVGAEASRFAALVSLGCPLGSALQRALDQLRGCTAPTASWLVM